MFIKVTLACAEMLFTGGTPISLTNLGKNGDVDVVFRAPNEDDDSTWPCRTIFEICHSLNPEPQILDEFKTMKQRKEKVDLERLEEGMQAHMEFYASDSIASQSFSNLSPSMQDLVNKSYKVCFDAKNRALQTICWRRGLFIENHDFRVGRHLWSIDKVNWHLIPVPVVMSDYQTEILYFNQLDQSEIEEKLRFETYPSLGYQLLGDAWYRKDANPYIALIMGVSALEAMTKSLILHHVSGSEWLVENIPSPPVVKILEKFAPEVMKLEKKFDVSGKSNFARKTELSVAKTIRDAINQRNKVVHGTTAQVSLNIESFLLVVRDILYWADYKCGEDWALENIRPEVKSALLSKESQI